MMLLFEGHVVRFAAPKATYDKEIGLCKHISIFAIPKASNIGCKELQYRRS